MYVCLKPSSVYVCMPQTYIHETKHTYTVSCHHAFGRPLSMYVCLKTLCFIMEMKHTYTLKVVWKARKIILRHLLSVYVCFKTCVFCRKNETSTLKHKLFFFISKIILSEPLERVCMFEIRVFYRQKLLKHTLSATLIFEWWCVLSMYVCLKTSCFVVLLAITTKPSSSNVMASWGSSESNTHRYYINTSIHTHIHTNFTLVALI